MIATVDGALYFRVSDKRSQMDSIENMGEPWLGMGVIGVPRPLVKGLK